MAAPTAGRTLSLWSASPGGDAVAGRDLVLEIPAEHGLELPVGAGLDDHLDESTRLLVDRRARERFREWSERRSAALTVEGLDLTSICELELLAQCFVPAARVDIALPRAIEVAGARALTLRALAPGIAGVIRAVAAREGVATSELSEAASGATMRWRGPSTAVRAVAAAGLPARVRGRVLCVPYPNLTPVLRRLAAGDARTRPVASGVLVPGLDLRSALETAARAAGWATRGPAPAALRASPWRAPSTPRLVARSRETSSRGRSTPGPSRTSASTLPVCSPAPGAPGGSSARTGCARSWCPSTSPLRWRDS